MDASQQAVWERDAGRRRAEMEAQSQNQVGEVLIDLETARSRRLEAQRQRPQLQMGACRSPEGQMASLGARCCSPGYSAEFAKRRREVAIQLVEQPSQHIKSALEAMEVGPSTVGVARVPWVAAVCRNRDSHKFSAFAWRSGGAWRYELFLFALENPLVACFVRPKEVGRGSAGEFFQAFATEDFAYWRHSFHIVADKFSSTDMSGSPSEDWPMVLMDCNLHRSGFLTSGLAGPPLGQVVDTNMLSAKASKSQSARSEKGVVVEDEAWLDLPWRSAALRYQHRYLRLRRLRHRHPRRRRATTTTTSICTRS